VGVEVKVDQPCQQLRNRKPIKLIREKREKVKSKKGNSGG
jgi:hypothetical protein